MKKKNIKLRLSEIDFEFLRYLSIYSSDKAISYGKISKFNDISKVRIRYRINKFLSMGLLIRKIDTDTTKVYYYISDIAVDLLEILEKINLNLQK